MVRGDYTVQDMEESKPPRQDTSFRKCVISMFIVFLLCVIIILIVWRVEPDGERSYKNAWDQQRDSPKSTTKPPGTSTTHHTFEITKSPPITTKKIQTTTSQEFVKIKSNTSQSTISIPTTQKQKITETSTANPTFKSTTSLNFTTSHTSLKYDQIIVQEDHTTSVPRTTDTSFTISTLKVDETSHVTTSGSTDSATVKEEKTTTHITPPHISQSENISSTWTIENISSTTTAIIVGIGNETVTTDLPHGGTITNTESNFTTISSGTTSTTGILNDTETTTLHMFVSDSNKTTPVVILKTTYKVTDETDEETFDTETAFTDSTFVAITKSQNVSSSLTTVPATTAERTHIPLVLQYVTATLTTASDVPSSSFKTISSSGTVPHVINATTESVYVTSQIPTEPDTTDTTEIDETATDDITTKIVVAVTKSQSTTSNTSITQSLTIVNTSTTAIIDDNVETTTDDLLTNVTVTDSQNTTLKSQVVTSTSVPNTTTHEKTTTDGLITHAAVFTTESQNRTTAGKETSIPSIGLEAVSESHTTATDIESTTPVIFHPTILAKDNKTCQTSECKVLASRMLSLMNHSVDPCDNFYEFACGGLRDNHALLQEDPEQDVWNRIASALRDVNSKSNIVYQKFRHFYDQCVDYEHNVKQNKRLELGQKVVDKVDKMYNNLEWIIANDNFSLTDILVKLFHVDSAPLFDVSVDVNPDNHTKFQLKLTVPRSKSKLQLESPSISHCKSHIFSEDQHNISMAEVYESNYLPCMRNTSEYLFNLEKAVMEMELFDNSTSAYNISQNIEAIKFFLEFDFFSLLDEINAWEVRTDTLEKKFTMLNVEDLAGKYPEVEWDVLFGALLNEAVNKETQVQVYFETYFDKLFGQLKSRMSNTTARLIIHNGLLAMLAHDIYVDLVKPRPCNREEYCLKTASVLMEDVSSSLYISTFTSKELSDKEHELVTLFHQLKNILNEEIVQASWLDEDARSAMVDKLQKMKIMADGGRAILNDSNYLRNQLNDQDLSISNTYFENAIQLLHRYRKLIYYLIKFESQPVAPEIIWTFFLLPYNTQPISVYQLNTIIIPYGMIGSWKITNNLPSFVLKARVGNEIARQIVHHFDSTGILYGPNGKNNNFLQDSGRDLYIQTYEECEAGFNTWDRTWTNQKNQIYHYTVNAARTMNEHFTDNSALWLTHKLFNKTIGSEPVLPWLERSHDELYLLLAAQEFCAKAELLDYTVMMFETEQLPPYLRAENMIVNSQVFGHIYGCPVGGKQNPNFKCPPFPQGEEASQYVPGSIPVA